MTAARVYLVRHAKAERDHSGGDAARRLTTDGRIAFAQLAGERRHQLAIARILSSPFVRALQTARVLAEVTGALLEEEPNLTSGRCSGAELLELARRAGPGAALVGHNPEIQEAIALAAGHGEEVRPGTIAAVELGAASTRLLWIAAPAPNA